MSNVIYSLILLTFFMTNCATILKGYHDKVEIYGSKNAQFEILDEYGQKFPIYSSGKESHNLAAINPENGKYITISSTNKYIKLRSNEKHSLEVRTDDSIQKITLFPKVGIGWITLDIITGVFPLVIDLYNGNLNHFDHLIIQNIE